MTPHASASSPSTTERRSAAEQSAPARLGAVLFRNRSWLPVPLVAVVLLAPSSATALHWIVAAALIVAGEWIRLAGIAAAGTATRRRSRDVQRLVTYGIFAWMRNPLYVGNFFIWMGFAAASGVLWSVPVAIALFAVEYALIVSYEEGVLESIFGEEYLRYKAIVPRWIPRKPREPRDGPTHWGEAALSERSTFLQYVGLVVLFALKQFYWR